MRFLVDALAALMVIGILAGVIMYKREAKGAEEARIWAREEVRRFQQQIHLQSALDTVEMGDRGYPATVDPSWFRDGRPRNPFLDSSHPWLEVAHADHADLFHPPQRTAQDEGFAAFWYNPGTGVVRARVPVGPSDQQTLELYNFVNDSAVGELYEAE